MIIVQGTKQSKSQIFYQKFEQISDEISLSEKQILPHGGHVIDELVLLEEDVQNETRSFSVAAFQNFVELVVRRIGEEICRTRFFLQRSLDRLFSGNGHGVVADGVKEVDALAGG